MRLFAVPLVLAMCLTLSAQEENKKKGPNPFADPKNLQVLTPETLRPTMMAIRTGLGVECIFCHVQGDFASDDYPKKTTARMMMRMVKDINAKFPDGETHVTCYTCHRGETRPRMVPPTP